MEAAGQLVRIFRYGLDYAFTRSPDPCGFGGRVRGVLSISFSLEMNPSVRSSTLSQTSGPMSLYRAGLRLAPFLPLGVAIAVSALGFTDVSPVFTLPLRAEATLLIEPASASPLPSGSTCVVCLYI